mgnify:CR=1 FL=1
MVNHAVKHLAPTDHSILFIENVGNLVCPAMFDLGEAKKVVIVSTTEGDDKPLKYPHIFAEADVCVINKTDLERKIDVEKIREKIPHIAELSASAGEGVQALEREVRELLQLSSLDSSSGIIANERQRACVEQATKTMDEARQALGYGETLAAVNVCIDSAIDSLLELTGERASEAVINQVFERFCVGK